MKKSTVKRKLLAWVLVISTVFSTCVPSDVSLFAEDANANTEKVEEASTEVKSEEATSEEVTTEAETEASETSAPASEEGKDETTTEITATSEEVTEEVTTESSTTGVEESSEDTVDEATTEAITEEATSEETTEEAVKAPLYLKITDGGTLKLKFADGTTCTVEKDDEGVVKVNKKDVLKKDDNGYYKLGEYEVDKTIEVEVKSAEDYKVETYSKLKDKGKVQEATFDLEATFQYTDSFKIEKVDTLEVSFKELTDEEKEALKASKEKEEEEATTEETTEAVIPDESTLNFKIGEGIYTWVNILNDEGEVLYTTGLTGKGGEVYQNDEVIGNTNEVISVKATGISEGTSMDVGSSIPLDTSREKSLFTISSNLYGEQFYSTDKIDEECNVTFTPGDIFNIVAKSKEKELDVEEDWSNGNTIGQYKNAGLYEPYTRHQKSKIGLKIAWYNTSKFEQMESRAKAWSSAKWSGGQVKSTLSDVLNLLKNGTEDQIKKYAYSGQNWFDTLKDMYNKCKTGKTQTNNGAINTVFGIVSHTGDIGGSHRASFTLSHTAGLLANNIKVSNLQCNTRHARASAWFPGEPAENGPWYVDGEGDLKVKKGRDGTDSISFSLRIYGYQDWGSDKESSAVYYAGQNWRCKKSWSVSLPTTSSKCNVTKQVIDPRTGGLWAEGNAAIADIYSIDGLKYRIDSDDGEKAGHTFTLEEEEEITTSDLVYNTGTGETSELDKNLWIRAYELADTMSIYLDPNGAMAQYNCHNDNGTNLSRIGFASEVITRTGDEDNNPATPDTTIVTNQTQANKTMNILFQNKIGLVNGNLILRKEDPTNGGAPIAGATFALYYIPDFYYGDEVRNWSPAQFMAAGAIYQGSCVTDGSGYANAVISNGYYGTYFLVETSAPKGYAISNEIRGVTFYREYGRYADNTINYGSRIDMASYWASRVGTESGDGSTVVLTDPFTGRVTTEFPTIEVANSADFDEYPARGTVGITKKASLTTDGSAEPGTSFAGVKYVICPRNNMTYYYDHGKSVTWVANKPIQMLNDAGVMEDLVLVCDPKGYAEIPVTTAFSKQLPMGSYYAKEIEGNQWYEKDDDTLYYFDINADNLRVELGETRGNATKRGDFRLIKTRKDGYPIKNTPFLVTSLADPTQQHIIVTDENGYFNSADFKGVTERNYYDKLLGKGTEKQDGGNRITWKEVGPYKGVFFGGEINDKLKDKGSLPVGEYKIEELWYEGNTHCEGLYAETFTIENDTVTDLGEFMPEGNGSSAVVDGKVILNIPDKPQVHTGVLSDSTGTRLVAESDEEWVTDTMTFENLEIGHKYLAVSKVTDKATGEILTDGQGIPVETVYTTWTAENNGEVHKANIKIGNTLDMEFKTGVVEVDVYDVTRAQTYGISITKDNLDEDYNMCSEHDLECEDQTIVIPDIKTQAYDITFGTHVAYPEFFDRNEEESTEEGNGTTEEENNGNGGSGTNSLSVKSLGAEGNGTTEEENNGGSTSKEENTGISSEVHVVQKDDFHRDVSIDIEDKITMYNFLEGETYQITGQVYLLREVPNDPKKLTIGGEDNRTIVAEVTMDDQELITIENPEEDSITVQYNIQQKDLDLRTGQQYVVYEQVWYTPEGSDTPLLVASHEDEEDESQKIYQPGLSSNISGTENGVSSAKHTLVVTAPGETTHVMDRLHVQSLCVGEEYTLHNELHFKDTGAMVVINDQPVEQTKTFTAEETNTNVDFEYDIDTSSLGGRDVTFVEYIEYKGIIINNHGDLQNDFEQGYLPVIRTKAHDVQTITNIGSLDSTVIEDTVTVKNVQTGFVHEIKGILMDKATGEYLGKDLGCGPYEAKIEVTPTERDFEATVDFTIPDSTILEGKDVVVFEGLYLDGKKVAFHEDINDEGQTIKFVKERTTAMWDNGTKLVNAEDTEFTLYDTVHYQNLVVGNTYTQTAKLWTDDGNGKAIPFLVDGVQPEVSISFVPEASEGDIVIPFVINTKDLAGSEFVVFEDLYYNGIKIATHSDLTDKDQTVRVPKIGTMATGKNGEKELELGTEIELIDEVEYEHLTPGEEYILSGRVVYETKSGKIKEVTNNEMKFKAENKGVITLGFAVDTDELAGKTLVVFENVYDLEGHLVASHEDIDDEGQSVVVKEHPGIPRTADTIYLIWMLGLAFIMSGVMSFTLVKKLSK